MKIHVRRRHIEAGTAGDADTCPIALAAQEDMGCSLYVLYRHLQAGEEMFELPRSAQRFIMAFDAGKPVKPFAFVLK